MLLAAKKCKCCQKVMIEKETKNLFPNFYAINQKAQMKAAGLVYMTATLVDDEPICIECEESGKASFLCELCDERKTTDKKQESFGDPAEFLCKDCYESVPAKKWHEKVDELQESHRWDFE
jgi:hypothetical protein